ncbi:rhodanese-like domain-containing protein [Streptomyces sp. AC495_CC817]|uniref:rhodanese-like domain-containing protein n=1 Tax=Streptomyces sp. AC495_CC817 TaxID=2823900 RepID=UPI001C25E103|nr:rhodanese-like domain-containing protein [Streptomyces sp. AC495_CC817]
MAHEVTQEAFAAAWADGALAIDAREADEYAARHPPGARLTPLRTAPGRRGELPSGRPVFVNGARGNRSRKASNWMTPPGVDARSAAGGTGAWARTRRPVTVGAREDAA